MVKKRHSRMKLFHWLKYILITECFTLNVFTQDCTKTESRLSHLLHGINSIKQGYWVRLNGDDLVCFHTRNNSPGRFRVKYDGFLGAIKLIHIFGYVTCRKAEKGHYSYWGCSNHPEHQWKDFNIFIVGPGSKQLFVEKQDMNFSWYSHDIFTPSSKQFVFMSMSSPYYVYENYEMELWYGDDKRDRNEQQSEGVTCVDVYGHYV